MSQTDPAVITGDAPEVLGFANRKALYGHRDWIGWQGKDGLWRAAPRSKASVKAAMLAMGTQGRFFLYHASIAHGASAMNWRMGVLQLSNIKIGY